MYIGGARKGTAGQMKDDNSLNQELQTQCLRSQVGLVRDIKCSGVCGQGRWHTRFEDIYIQIKNKNTVAAKQNTSLGFFFGQQSEPKQSQ